MTQLALARALERLAPFYRERMVVALARALADGGLKPGLEYLDNLDAGEIKRAHRLAAALRTRRDVALFERRLARRIAVVMTLVRRIGSAIRRRTT